MSSSNISDEISGSVERITYYNKENGYTVMRIQPDERAMLAYQYASGRNALITVIGNLPELNVGEWLKLMGRWENHPKHGRQFHVEKYSQALPATAQGIKRYLGSGLIRGVGRVMAERIVDQFGTETIDVIEQTPERLTEVDGIGPKRISGIVKAWEEQRAIKEVMLFLQSHNVTTGLATKIYKHYGDDALRIVQKTPYQMVQDIHGIGFKTADTIARALGLASDDPGRIEAGIAYTLNRMTQDGHVFVPQHELEPAAADILGVPELAVHAVIDALESDRLIIREEMPLAPDPTANLPKVVDTQTAVYLRPYFFAEVGTAKRIQQIIEHPTSRVRRGTNQAPQLSLLSNAQLSGVQLSPEQAQAVETAITNKVTVLTGGPGTGKTTTLRVLLDALDHTGRTYALASPTGRAAKRLAEATGRQAKTIHRLLAFKPAEGFTFNEENPIDADMIVIDECSMLDIQLANSLLKAVPADSHLLLVGDVDQLPSVGAGDVLRDLIASNIPAIVRLQTIFRQATTSLIVSNAHHINHGRMPQTDEKSRDFFIFVKQDPEELAELIVDIVQRRIPSRFNIDPFDDIQVLAPMYQGAAGVSNLNSILQEGLNPGGKRKGERRTGGRTYRVGDKVMQTVNNYDKSVFNGDIGRITKIDTVQQTVSVNMDGKPVVYDFLEMDELVHAYAITVHKSQGSEYPCVVVPVVTQHYLMLQRNLLYTAVTRAKKLVILAGTRQAINIAVRNNKVNERHTALDWRLNPAI